MCKRQRLISSPGLPEMRKMTTCTHLLHVCVPYSYAISIRDPLKGPLPPLPLLQSLRRPLKAFLCPTRASFRGLPPPTYKALYPLPYRTTSWLDVRVAESTKLYTSQPHCYLQHNIADTLLLIVHFFAQPLQKVRSAQIDLRISKGSLS